MGGHCNAHTNNLVLRPPPAKSAASSSSSPVPDAQSGLSYPSDNAFLAMLDLDMAFTEASFLGGANAFGGSSNHASNTVDKNVASKKHEEVPGVSQKGKKGPAQSGVAKHAKSGAFDTVLATERRMLLLAVAGDPDCSTGVTRTQRREIPPGGDPVGEAEEDRGWGAGPGEPNGSGNGRWRSDPFCLAPGKANRLQSLKWALRDTMAVGFLTALRGEEDIHPVSLRLHDACYAMLKLALVVTADQIA